jgi:hypothetical protein
MVPLAEAYAIVGSLDDAMVLIELHFARGCLTYPHLLQSPLYDPLRGYPRFERFLPEARRRWEELAERLKDVAPF